MKTKISALFLSLISLCLGQNQAVIFPTVGNYNIEDVYNSTIPTPTFLTWWADNDPTSDMFRLTDGTNQGAPLNAYMTNHFFVDRIGGLAFLTLDESAITYSNLSGLPTLGTAAAQDTSAFATSVQGSTADSALQPASIGSTVQGFITAGTNTEYYRGDKTWQTWINSDWNAVSGGAQILNKPTIPTNNNQLTNGSGFVDQAGARSAISLTTTGTSGAATYNSSTGVINIPNYDTPVAPTITNNVSRSLNSNYTISSTLRARVNYSINISWTLQALLSGTGSAFLEYSTNAGSSWVTVTQVTKTIGLLTFAGADDMNLSGEIELGALVRIRTTSTNMTVAYTRGQEVTY